MTEKANAVRTLSGMREGKAFVDALLAELDTASLTELSQYELYAMAQTADMIFTGAIERTESVGAHYVEA